jgi:hypothetical protein
VATFSNLQIQKAGVGYTLTATNSLTPATSQPFNITAAAASKLVFLQQPPTSVAVNAIISPAVTVQVQDQFGNVTTSSAAVTMGLGTKPPGSKLNGTKTVNAVNGVATFSNLSINKTGTFTLVASATGLSAATSTSFTVL